MYFQYFLISVLGIGSLVLLWQLRIKNRQHRQLRAELDLLRFNYTWIANATDKALLFVEDQHITWMNEKAQTLFGGSLPKKLDSLFYHSPDKTVLLQKESIRCQCLGIDDYLFPAAIQLQRDPHSSRVMLIIEDENFQAHPFASLQSQPQPQSQPEHTQQDAPSIVIVDDDDAVLETYSDMLAFEGWTVHAFASAQLALPFIEHNQDHIAIVITDYQLRDMTGVEVLKQVKQYAPHIKGLVISGFNLSEKLYDGFPFLQKPCSRSSLIQTLQGLIQDNS